MKGAAPHPCACCWAKYVMKSIAEYNPPAYGPMDASTLVGAR